MKITKTQLQKLVTEAVERAFLSEQDMSKLKKLFESLLKAHDKVLKSQVTSDLKALRSRIAKKYPKDVRAAVIKLRSKGKEFPSSLAWWSENFRAEAWEAVHDDKLFKRGLKRVVEEEIKRNRIKLEHAIQSKLGKLPIKSVKEVHSHIGSQGIEGRYMITLEDGTKGHLDTRSISAGGWNIQRYHFRYLMTLDRKLAAKQAEAPDAVGLQAVAVLKILAKHIEQFEPVEHNAEVMKVPRAARREVEELKGASRNWGPLNKLRYVSRYEDPPGFYIKRWAYFLTRKGFEALGDYR